VCALGVWKYFQKYILEEINMKKRILSLALALVLCLSLAVPALAASATEHDTLTIAVKEIPGFEITFTNVIGYCQFLYEPAMSHPYSLSIEADFDSVSFNRDITASFIFYNNAVILGSLSASQIKPKP
jgi:hypothetical protein